MEANLPGAIAPWHSPCLLPGAPRGGWRRASWKFMLHRFALAMFLIAATTTHTYAQVASGPELLTYDELVMLASPAQPPAEVAAKLERVLNEPFLRTRASSPKPLRTTTLRVASWNIERGREWRLIRLALTDLPAFRAVLGRVPEVEWQAAVKQIEVLRAADVLILNEVDVGMKRTGYVNVAEELARALGMNYTFGVEFVEVDPLYTGGERIELEDEERTEALAQDLQADPQRYKGLHGNAILSRFPIRSARIHRLPQCYDWLEEEAKQIAGLEKGKRWSAKRLFAERIRRQIRRGGRMALIAELETGAEGAGTITAVSSHLEDRSTAPCRRDEMKDLLAEIRDTPGTVVVGGDLNTSGGDGTPTSLRYEVMKRVTDERFWVGNAFRWFSPVVVPALVLWPVNYFKNFRDPTAVSIPILAPNPERGLFEDVRAFRFADGGAFDFGGNSKSKTLANSNERGWKGFHSTYRFERTYFGVFGMYRLDWLFIKPGADDALQPGSPQTLRAFNKVALERLSDHEPIVVDLTLQPRGVLQAGVVD